MEKSNVKKRVVILGGGFGGVATARHLERKLRRRTDVEVVLVSRDNFVLMTPLLFDVVSGTLDVRDCSVSIRAFLRSTRFVEATVDGIDLDRGMVRVNAAGHRSELAYDHLVLALGSTTNRDVIPESEHALTFKTVADALVLRNHVIERFELADAETDVERRAHLLTFVIIGGGLVGVELLGELTAFVDTIAPLYKSVNRDDVRFLLLQGAERLIPETDPTLAAYGADVLARRPGVEVRTNTRVHAISSGRVHLAKETIGADTIVLAAGTAPNPVIAVLPISKDRRGRIIVEATMSCPSHPNVWALGDCASIPGPDGVPYPSLAQHALREARALAANVAGALDGRPPQPFIYHMLGMTGSLGHNKGFSKFLGLRVRGVPAWFLRRCYYLMQMPGWGRRLRLFIDWTLALFHRPGPIRIGLDRETSRRLYEELAADTAG